MTTSAIVGGRVLGCRRSRTAEAPTAVLLCDGTIVSVQNDPTGADEVLDAAGLLVAPGFVDLQSNGGHGIDLTVAPERLWELAELLPRYGVTSFLPTIVTCGAAVVRRAMATLAERPKGFRGAHPIGLHLEGPMLSPARRGAHQEELLQAPDQALVSGWRRDGGVAMVTLAPELPGALEVTRLLRKQGVVVAAGHTDATAAEVLAGVDAGITGLTHLFNAMRPFTHREPGPVGVALADPRVIAGLIADGQHVHPLAVAAAWSALGPTRLALVTDSVSALGAHESSVHLAGSQLVVTEDGVFNAEGRRAGSTLAMDEAVRNLVGFTGCSAEAAIASATRTPARLIGANKKGLIAPGADADLVILTPELRVVAVIVRGAIVHGETEWKS